MFFLPVNAWHSRDSYAFGTAKSFHPTSALELALGVEFVKNTWNRGDVLFARMLPMNAGDPPLVPKW